MSHGETSSVPPPPRPLSSLQQQPKTKIPWAWITVGVVLSIMVLEWFGQMVWKGYHQAGQFGEELHAQMAHRDWDGIYRAASPTYQGSRSEDESKKFFEAIDRKLGVPKSTHILNVFVDSNFTGTTVRAVFETQFSKQARATETISWTSLTGKFYLASYEIKSDDLITR